MPCLGQISLACTGRPFNKHGLSHFRRQPDNLYQNRVCRVSGVTKSEGDFLWRAEDHQLESTCNGPPGTATTSSSETALGNGWEIYRETSVKKSEMDVWDIGHWSDSGRFGHPAIR